MGVTKTELFTEEQNQLAQIAKVFAHPARIAIIHQLLETNSCVNGDLVRELRLAQATISQHLRELKQIGLIKGKIEGSSISYCIDAERWEEVKGLFATMFDQYRGPRPEDCC